MKRLSKSFTFWFLIASIIIIAAHQMGHDSKSIVLIGLNPILNHLPNEIMNAGLQISCNTISGSISIYWYIASILSMLFYGIVLDGIRYWIKKRIRFPRS